MLCLNFDKSGANTILNPNKRNIIRLLFGLLLPPPFSKPTSFQKPFPAQLQRDFQFGHNFRLIGVLGSVHRVNNFVTKRLVHSPFFDRLERGLYSEPGLIGISLCHETLQDVVYGESDLGLDVCEFFVDFVSHDEGEESDKIGLIVVEFEGFDDPEHPFYYNAFFC